MWKTLRSLLLKLWMSKPIAVESLDTEHSWRRKRLAIQVYRYFWRPPAPPKKIIDLPVTDADSRMLEQVKDVDIEKFRMIPKPHNKESWATAYERKSLES